MIRIGTSGWAYEHWKGIFYPGDLPQDERLRFYAHSFRTVEVNNTFYHLPSEEAVRGWKQAVPDDFLFAVKASRYITHMKKLLAPEQPLKLFLARMEALGEKLGPVLFQLPPGWHVNAERLRRFVESLSPGHRYAFEFRDASWYTEEVYAILQAGGCAFCIHDHQDAPSPLVVTGKFAYVRFHGTLGGYAGRYHERALSDWAYRLKAWQEEGVEAFCYFNNDWRGYAVENAKELHEMILGD